MLWLWLFFAVLTPWVASSKGRSVFGWLILGLLFGIFALIAVALLPSLQSQPVTIDSAADDSAAPDQINCPFCAEPIKAQAVKCKHCQSDLRIETTA